MRNKRFKLESPIIKRSFNDAEIGEIKHDAGLNETRVYIKERCGLTYDDLKYLAKLVRKWKHDN